MPRLSKAVLCRWDNKGINIQFTSKFLTDGTYYFIIGYQTGRSNKNTAEQLEVDIPVEMFHQVAV